MNSSEPDISVSGAELDDGTPALVVKIQTETVEMNVWIPEHELPLLNMVENADWDNRASLQIGSCAKAPAFWSSRHDELSILVGHDDESWDFGVTLPRTALEQILAGVDAEQAAARTGVKGRGA